MNAYLDEGNWDNAQDLYHHIQQCSLPDSVIYSVFINGLDNKARTTQIRKELLKFNYIWSFDRPILEYHRTMVENSNSDDDDEFKRVVELIEGICIKGLENVFDILLKSNYKPAGIDDGILYNLFIIAHCKHYNVDEAYIMYKEMVHYGFACHMFTVFALIKTLKKKYMVNELRWVIQNVLRSCNLDDSEIVKFLNEFNPKKPEALLGDTEYDIEDDTETLLDDTEYETEDDDTEDENEDDDTEDDTEDDTKFNTEALLKDTEALLDDTEAFLNDTEALFDVLAEKAKDGLFLECSYAPTKAEEPSHADQTWQVKRSSPNKTTFMCLIDAFCKQDRFDMAYRVLNEMIISGFSPSLVTVNDVLCGFLRIGDMRKAFDMYTKMDEHFFESWIDHETHLLLLQGLSDEVTYTSLINAYLDEGKCDDAENLYCEMQRLDKFLHQNEITHICSLPYSVIYSVFINGLNNKARTTEVNKYLLRFNYGSYMISAYRPILEYHLTLAENCSDDEFKSLVELVDGFCNRGLENAYDTMLKSNYKPDGIDDGIVYNLFVIAHCQRHNIDEAYNMYKEMVHCGFACHMFTMFALVATLYKELQLNGFNKKRKNCKDIVNQLLWVIQNVLRSCNLNDSEIVNFLNEFNPEKPISESLFYVLAEKAKDGMFLKCSYSPPSA